MGEENKNEKPPKVKNNLKDQNELNYLNNLQNKRFFEGDLIAEGLQNPDAIQRMKKVKEFFENRKPSEFTIDINDVSQFLPEADGYYFSEIIDNSYAIDLGKLKSIVNIIGWKRAAILAKSIMADSEKILTDAAKEISIEEIGKLIDEYGGNALYILLLFHQFYKQEESPNQKKALLERMSLLTKKYSKLTSTAIYTFINLVKNEEELNHLIALEEEGVKIPNCLGPLLLIGVINIMDIDAKMMQDLDNIQYEIIGTSELAFNKRTNTFRIILQHINLSELIELAKIFQSYKVSLHEQTTYLINPFSSFLNFLCAIRHLLKGQNIKNIAKEFIKRNIYAGTSFYELMPYASSIDEALNIQGRIKSFSAQSNKENLDKLVELYPPITDETLESFKGGFASLFKDLEAYIHERDINNKMPLEEAKSLVAYRLLVPSKITKKSIQKLYEIDPVLSRIYQKVKDVDGYNTDIEDRLIVRNMGALSQYQKASDRSPSYLLQRGYAEYINNYNEVLLSQLDHRVEKIGEMIYEHYTSKDKEVVRAIKVDVKNVRFGVYYSKDSNILQGEPADTPIKQQEGVIFETTGSMVDKDGKPIELLAINGKILNYNINSSHDGILVIDRNGIPHIEHMESFDASVIGIGGKIDVKFAARPLLANGIKRKSLTVMQGSLLIRDSKSMPITASGTAWYKRAFVEFNDGNFGFVETKQPMDNITFTRIILDSGGKNAMLLDTGYYNRYVDKNGNNEQGEKFNPILIYGKTK